MGNAPTATGVVDDDERLSCVESANTAAQTGHITALNGVAVAGVGPLAGEASPENVVFGGAREGRSAPSGVKPSGFARPFGLRGWTPEFAPLLVTVVPHSVVGVASAAT